MNISHFGPLRTVGYPAVWPTPLTDTAVKPAKWPNMAKFTKFMKKVIKSGPKEVHF